MPSSRKCLLCNPVVINNIHSLSSYVLLHASRKTFSNVKVSITAQWTPSAFQQNSSTSSLSPGEVRLLCITVSNISPSLIDMIAVGMRLLLLLLFTSNPFLIYVFFIRINFFTDVKVWTLILKTQKRNRLPLLVQWKYIYIKAFTFVVYICGIWIIVLNYYDLTFQIIIWYNVQFDLLCTCMFLHCISIWEKQSPIITP